MPRVQWYDWKLLRLRLSGRCCAGRRLLLRRRIHGLNLPELGGLGFVGAVVEKQKNQPDNRRHE